MSPRTGLMLLSAWAGLTACGPDNEMTFEDEVQFPCNNVCVLEQMCTDREPASCIRDCYDMIEYMTPPRPPCDAARLELVDCESTLDCEQLAASREGLANPCSPEADEVEAQCDE